MGFYANVISSLTQLGNLSTQDLNASVVAPLNIPNPMTERAQAFANALSYLEGVDSMELNYRYQVRSLYQIFSRYEALAGRSTASPSNETTKRNTVYEALNQLENEASQRDSLRQIQESLAQILNLPGQNPIPIPETRPDLDYEDRLPKLIVGENYGILATRLSAYQIEGALLREKGVKMNQWPSVWVNSSLPSLYESNQGRSGSSFETERISLFAGLTKTYDITGYEADQVKNAKDNTEYVKKSLRLRLDQETRQWLHLRESYSKILLKEKIARERLAQLQVKENGSAFMDLKQLRNAQNTLASLSYSKEQLELEIWMWDDEKW